MYPTTCASIVSFVRIISRDPRFSVYTNTSSIDWIKHTRELDRGFVLFGRSAQRELFHLVRERGKNQTPTPSPVTIVRPPGDGRLFYDVLCSSGLVSPPKELLECGGRGRDETREMNSLTILHENRSCANNTLNVFAGRQRRPSDGGTGHRAERAGRPGELRRDGMRGQAVLSRPVHADIRVREMDRRRHVFVRIDETVQ